MGVNLAAHINPATTFYRGDETLTLSAGAVLNKIDVTPNQHVPAGKVWTVVATISVTETDAV